MPLKMVIWNFDCHKAWVKHYWLVGRMGTQKKTDIAMENSPFLIGDSSPNGCSSIVMLVFHVFRAVLL